MKQSEREGVPQDLKKLWMMGRRIQRARNVIALALALPILGVSSAEGQSSDSVSISVFVADAVTARPLANVRVEFRELKMSELTDSLGEAYFKVSPGLARLRANKIGYRERRETLVVGLSDELDVTVGLQRLDPSQRLDTVTVRGTRPPEYLREFEQRRALGLGKFILTPELDSAKHERFADFATRKLLGVRVEWGIPPVSAKLMSLRGYVRFKSGKDRCSATVYVDDIPIDEFDLASLVTGDIAAVEYYPTSPPVKYSKAGSLCGVIVVWTKR